jgi:predicted acylesterase/phospholipase RssA
VSPTAPLRKRRYALSLAGGGYRGLFAAEFLTLLEARTGPLPDRFDIVAGTSVGSLTALSLAAGKTAKSVRDEMLKLGPSVFPPEPYPLNHLVTRIFGAKRDVSKLRSAIEGLLGEQTLGDVTRALLVPAVDLTKGGFKLFRSRGLSGSDADAAARLVDVALASAAAPTYFPVHAIDTRLYADGGLFANAPDAALAIEVAYRLRWPPESTWVLSVGTTLRSPAMASSGVSIDMSTPEWAKVLLDVSMAAQIDFTRGLVREIFRDRAIVIDPERSSRQDDAVGLDKADATATNTLQSMAKIAFEDFERAHGELIERLKARA